MLRNWLWDDSLLQHFEFDMARIFLHDMDNNNSKNDT